MASQEPQRPPKQQPSQLQHQPLQSEQQQQPQPQQQQQQQQQQQGQEGGMSIGNPSSAVSPRPLTSSQVRQQLLLGSPLVTPSLNAQVALLRDFVVSPSATGFA